MASDFEDRVRERAYALWQLAGSPPNREQDFWFQAEQEVITERVLRGLKNGSAESSPSPREEAAPPDTRRRADRA